MTKEGSTKIVNFMTPRVGVLVLGRGHISHICLDISSVSENLSRGCSLSRKTLSRRKALSFSNKIKNAAIFIFSLLQQIFCSYECYTKERVGAFVKLGQILHL